MGARVFTAPLYDGGDFHGELSCSFKFVSKVEVDDIPGKCIPSSLETENMKWEHREGESPCSAPCSSYFCAHEGYFL